MIPPQEILDRLDELETLIETIPNWSHRVMIAEWSDGMRDRVKEEKLIQQEREKQLEPEIN